MSFIAGAILISAGVAAAAGVTTSAINANQAKKERYRQDDIAATQAEMLAELESSRPEFKNPYENMQNQFKDLNNPYANLTVATEAFKMEAEQADQALANSLDVMMETGQAAGGATALAQAALQSKRGIAASIQAQETQNRKMAAEGAANVALQKAQGAQRVDEMRAKGDTMEQGDAINFHEKKMNRAAGLMENAQQNSKDAQAARSAAIAGIGDSVAQGASIASGAFGVPG
tara:strand:- start:10897 stop:11592 length:696 start_codon:yes stop_codon:yes gene_type:complete